MEKKLQERLVGSAVLISLAVVFLPELLRPPDEFSTVVVDSSIPPVPAYRDLPPPAEPLILILGSTPSASGEARSSSEPLTASGNATGRRGLEIPSDLRGWVVQVGTFAEQANALTLRDELRNQGYAGYVEEVRGKNRPLYRVRVGPELEKSRAQSALARIREEFGLEPRLQRHP